MSIIPLSMTFLDILDLLLTSLDLCPYRFYLPVRKAILSMTFLEILLTFLDLIISPHRFYLSIWKEGIHSATFLDLLLTFLDLCQCRFYLPVRKEAIHSMTFLNLLLTFLDLCTYRFYLSVRKEAIQKLTDGTGHRPHYSLRTLCRALKLASTNQCDSVPRSLYEVSTRLIPGVPKKRNSGFSVPCDLRVSYFLHH